MSSLNVSKVSTVRNKKKNLEETAMSIKEIKEYSNPIESINIDDNVYIKLMKKKSLELNIIDNNGNKSPGNFSILFITKNKNSFNNESKVLDSIVCLDVDSLIRFIKRSGRISNKHRTCKIIDNNYKCTEEECFVWLYEKNSQDNYIKLLNYMTEKSNKINEDIENNVQKEKKTRSQRKRPKEEVSFYRGVKYTSYKPYKFLTNISKDKIRYYLGIYDDEKIAAYAYNCRALELYGKDYKKFNKVDKPDGYIWNTDISRMVIDK
jgi:hypothetical protein